VYIKPEMARVGGEPVRLYRAVVEQRIADWLPWENVDASLLYDSVVECLKAGEELQELYQPPENVSG
jgi:hypothetical protein